MKWTTKIAVLLAIACWLVLISWVAVLTSDSRLDSERNIPALPYAIGLAIILFLFGTFLIICKKRLAFISICFICLATIMCSFWIGSIFAYRYTDVKFFSWKIINKEKYLQEIRFWVVSSRGGMRLEYEVNFYSGNAMDGLNWKDYPIINWGQSPAKDSQYPYVPIYNKKMPPPKPIPQCCGFDSCWVEASVPPVFGYWNRRARYALTVPTWFPIVLCTIVPFFWLRRLLRERHRVRHNLCLICGYDLRESQDQCPECGTAIVGKKR